MADETSRRLSLARRAVGALTGLLLLVALGAFVTGNENRAFWDLGETARARCWQRSTARWPPARRPAGSGSPGVGWPGPPCHGRSARAFWSWYELVLHTAAPFPGLADVGFLGFPLGAVIALAVFPSNVSHADRRRMTLDGLMAASAIGLVSWATAWGPWSMQAATRCLRCPYRWPTHCPTSPCWSSACWCCPGPGPTGCHWRSSPQGLC